MTNPKLHENYSNTSRISRYGLFPLYHNKKRLHILFTENLSRITGQPQAMTRRAFGEQAAIWAGYSGAEYTPGYDFMANYLAAYW